MSTYFNMFIYLVIYLNIWYFFHFEKTSEQQQEESDYQVTIENKNYETHLLDHQSCLDLFLQHSKIY